MSRESEAKLKEELKETLKELLPRKLADIKEERELLKTAFKSGEEYLKDKKLISNEEWRNATPEQMRIEFSFFGQLILHLWDKVLKNEAMTLLQGAFVYEIYDEVPSESEQSQILTLRKELEELKEFHKYVLETVTNRSTPKKTDFEGLYV